MIFLKAGRTTIKNYLAILLCVAYFFHLPTPSPPHTPGGIYIYIYFVCDCWQKKLIGRMYNLNNWVKNEGEG